MNGPATFRDQYWLPGGIFAAHNPISGREKTMTGAVAAFGIAVGGTSLICYLLITRLQNRRAIRGSSGNGSGADGGDYGGGWSLSHGFGSDHSALDPSGNPIDFGGGDSGGDAGGVDGGGGGD
jgi:hypothetical protein